MIASELTADSGLLPSGVQELQFRAVQHDQFCWVFTDDPLKERLVSLPSNQADAIRELAEILQKDHAFVPADAELAAQSLIERAYAGIADPLAVPAATPAAETWPELAPARSASERRGASLSW